MSVWLFTAQERWWCKIILDPFGNILLIILGDVTAQEGRSASRVTNLQVMPRDPTELQLIFRWKRSILLETMAALKRSLYGIMPIKILSFSNLVLLSPPTPKSPWISQALGGNFNYT